MGQPRPQPAVRTRRRALLQIWVQVQEGHKDLAQLALKALSNHVPQGRPLRGLRGRHPPRNRPAWHHQWPPQPAIPALAVQHAPAALRRDRSCRIRLRRVSSPSSASSSSSRDSEAPAPAGWRLRVPTIRGIGTVNLFVSGGMTIHFLIKRILRRGHTPCLKTSKDSGTGWNH